MGNPTRQFLLRGSLSLTIAETHSLTRGSKGGQAPYAFTFYLQPKPEPPKCCPICRVAMQVTQTREGVVYRCAQCGTHVKVGKSE